MSAAISVVNSSLNDIDFIFRLFDSAITYQKQKGYNLWPAFEKQLIETEINEGRHYKILNQENIICVFSVMYSDPVIWRERNKDAAVYLHRIAVNPMYKGRKIMKHVREWAINHAKKNEKHFVRMDTWGNNETLRTYYINCGFIYIGQQYLNDVPGQTPHYGGNELSLFEIKC